MKKEIVLALDGMGGDHAPDIVVRGLSLFVEPGVKFLLYGDESKLKPLVDRFLPSGHPVEVIHTEDVVKPDAKPSSVIRHQRKSSMAMAIMAVRDGRADAVVSAGNTGAYMALSKIMIGMMKGIERPAIATFIPNLHGKSLVLDLGANVDCSCRNLVEFAVMGQALACAELGIESPRVGLLNIGTEHLKGSSLVQEVHSSLSESGVLSNYIGFIEGDAICEGGADVVVTDGFTGNVALKTAEGTVKLVTTILKEALVSSAMSKIGAILCKKAIKSSFNKIDPRNHNGAVLLGLNGVSVKSHGGTDEVGFAQAIRFAANIVRADFVNSVQVMLNKSV